MDSTKKETINIFLKNNNDNTNDILKDSTTYERYIIQMNETLQIDNRNLVKEVHDLEEKKNLLEEENESYDTSKRYTRGLLKNLVELQKLHSQITFNTKFILLENDKYIKNFYNNQKYYFRLLEYFFIILFSFIFNLNLFTYLQFFIFSISIGSVFIYNEYMFYIFNIPDFNLERQKIIDVEQEIKKIDDSQDFLNEYIDCL